MVVPDLNVSEKVVIITGASRGIGRALSLGFAEAGASVALAARDVSRLDLVIEQARASGGKAIAVPTDVTIASEVKKLARTVVGEYGRVDVLINCAGGAGSRPFIPLLEMEESRWDSVLALNLKGVYLCCREIGTIMAKQRYGSIINFSSGAGTRPVQGQTHYGAAKAGVNQLTRVLAVELGSSNVRVNAISPGLIATQASRDFLDPKLFAKFEKAIPLGRAGVPEDILGTALFLASDASSYVTGTIIPVGGGPE